MNKVYCLYLLLFFGVVLTTQSQNKYSIGLINGVNITGFHTKYSISTSDIRGYTGGVIDDTFLLVGELLYNKKSG